MKKIRVLFPIILIILFILACTLPSSVDVKWTPELTISSKSDFSSMLNSYFTDFINSTDDMVIIPWGKEDHEAMTFLLYLPIIGDEKDGELNEALRNLAEEEMNDTFPGLGYTVDNLPPGWDWNSSPQNLPADKELLKIDEPITLEMSGLGEVISGFIFKEIGASLYTDGTNIMESIHIKVAISGSETIPLEFGAGATSASTGLTGFDYNWETCDWQNLPNNGRSIDEDKLIKMINNNEDLKITYQIFLKAGKKIQESWFNTHQQVKAEMAVMLPLDFEADTGGADLSFQNFFGEGDLFKRKDGDESNIIQYLELKIKLNTNPFRDAALHIKNDKGNIDIDIENIEDEIDILFDEETMKKINDPESIPFSPTLLYHFDPGDELIIPKEFETRELYFKVKILYNISLNGNEE